MSGPPDASGSKAGSLPLVAGVLALDFCNTSSGRRTEGLIEHLLTPKHLVEWCRHAGILDEAGEANIRMRCEDVGFGRDLLQRARKLRDAIYSLNATMASRGEPNQVDMDIIAATHADCLKAGRLTAKKGSIGWTWQPEQAPKAALLGPIASSAMALLTQADRARLKQCDGHHCGWLFLDTTKSNNRRWCEMEVCGNRAKQSRKRERGRDAS